jgi:mannosyltransferase OCH1-like enzyme
VTSTLNFHAHSIIPRRLVRTVPERTIELAEDLWRQACALHPDWEHVTLRDPIPTGRFPITSKHWNTCESGAQLADLVRAEELYHRGGIYIDSDVEVWRSFEPLVYLPGFAAWEDEQHIPNAVMGFTAGHPALLEVLKRAIERHHQGTWAAGVGVTTEVFADRDDMLVLPPGALYPVHYSMKQFMDCSEVIRAENPWAFCLHRWEHSWAPK